MTAVRFRFRRAGQEGETPPHGMVYCTPTTRVQEDDSTLLLPVPFAAALPDDGSDLVLDLRPTGRDWCWRVRECVEGYAHTRHIAVPESVQTLDYATLSEVDWQPAGSTGMTAHSIRSYARKITTGSTVAGTALVPSDNVSVGDTVVDATGHMWVVSRVEDNKVTFGIDTGVTLAGAKGDRGPGLLTGMGVPTEATQGIVGDSYLDLATGEVYKLNL